MPPGRGSVKVLVIDDEEDIREIACLSLSELGGHQVVEAACGSEGITAAAAERPDVILMDVMMPDMDGPSTLGCLKSNPETASIPVVFLTARAEASEAARLMEMGAAGVLIKPFDPLALASDLAKVLEGS